MSALNQIPWEQLAVTAEECACIFGCRNAKSFLETYACKPSFPKRIGQRPATWIAGEVIEWRNANRADQPIRRRSRGSKSSGSAGPGGQSPAQAA